MVNLRIHQLIQSGIISRVGKGKFTLGTTKEFKPIITSKEIAISAELKNHFPFIDYCIWDTAIIKEFSLHQSFSNFLIIEAERAALEAVFHFLRDQYKWVYLKPKQDMVENYLLEMEGVMITQHLVSEAPLQSVQEVPTLTIEKLLVDLLVGKDLFYFYQGYELHHIFQQAFDKYTINESTLLRYASRRKKKKAVFEVLKTVNRH